MQQLLSATGRAEKFLKSAIENLKKAEQKQAAEARKPKKPDHDSISLFDQGIEKASQIPRHAAGSVIAKADVARPFILEVNAWVGELLQEGSGPRAQVDNFKTAFDVARGKQKGVRLSKALDSDPGSTMYLGKVEEVFRSSDTLAARSSFPASLVPHTMSSIFGVDSSYDRVSGEGLGLATVRLCLQGTRQVVMTDMLQLKGYMERKGVSGAINSVRMSSFFRHMSPAIVAEYGKECTLWASTVSAGDLLYTPYGFLQGELVSQVTIGIRTPVIVKASCYPNVEVAVKVRKDEMELHVSSESALKDKAEVEIPLLQDLMKVMTSTPPPSTATSKNEAGVETSGVTAEQQQPATTQDEEKPKHAPADADGQNLTEL